MESYDVESQGKEPREKHTERTIKCTLHHAFSVDGRVEAATM